VLTIVGTVFFMVMWGIRAIDERVLIPTFIREGWFFVLDFVPALFLAFSKDK